MIIIKDRYCISELAAMKLPRWPTSRQGWHALANSESWPFIEVAIATEKTGVRYDYVPSHEVMLAIAANTEVGKSMLEKLVVKK